MAFCAKCGAQLNAGSGFCAACGTAVSNQGAGASAAPASAPAAAGAPTSAPMANNVAGLLCYILGIITGIVFLVLEPYKNNRFVRFHAFQSIFFWVACFAFWMVWSYVVVSMLFTPGLGMWGLISLIGLVVRLGMLAAWIFVMYKAYNNEEFKLPIIGDIAAKQAGA